MTDERPAKKNEQIPANDGENLPDEESGKMNPPSVYSFPSFSQA
jgi:hypothetical protein